MLFHLVLYDLTISLLNSLKVALGLCKLILAVKYQSLRTLDLLSDIPHDLWDYIDLI